MEKLGRKNNKFYIEFENSNDIEYVKFMDAIEGIKTFRSNKISCKLIYKNERGYEKVIINYEGK